jgi:GcrA cell cycle regulator
MRRTWTDDDIELLKRLWAEGQTAEAIATRLGGQSRSAVLGKVFRLRLAPAPKTKAAAKPAPIARRRGGSAPVPAPKKKLAPRGKSLFDLTNNCCRWPYRRPGAERYFFCGDPSADLEAGRPYCPEHMRRAYLVQPPLVVSPRRKTPRAA